MKKPVIAIDGYSSTGKSSISKEIAEKLGLIHIDTGALYRAITFFALQNCCDQRGSLNPELLLDKMDQLNLEFKKFGQELKLFSNGKDISTEIRQPQVSDHVSAIAKIPFVREYLLKMLRKMADDGGVIMDGRDIGTVVLPDADYKFFLTASIDERTRRRYHELESTGIISDVQSVRKNLEKRDKIDSEREIAPLKMAEDAILIDNTHLGKLETAQLILSKII